MVCDDVEAGCDKPQADDFNRIAAKRSHLIGQKPDLGPTAGLLVTDDERSVRQPQCRDLGKRDVAGRHPLPLYPAVWIQEDEVRAAHRIDECAEPLPARCRSSGHLLAKEDCVAQYSAHVQIR